MGLLWNGGVIACRDQCWHLAWGDSQFELMDNQRSQSRLKACTVLLQKNVLWAIAGDSAGGKKINTRSPKDHYLGLKSKTIFFRCAVSTEIFEGGAWRSGPDAPAPYLGQGCALLPGNKVLMAGGYDDSFPVGNKYRYNACISTHTSISIDNK